jgi:hypothetical protein
MERPSAQLEAAFAKFSSQHGADQAAQLRAALTSNNTLLRELNKSVASGAVKAFDIAASGMPQGTVGHFDTSVGTMKFPPSVFSPSGTSPTGDLIAVGRIQSMLATFSAASYTDNAGKAYPVSGAMVDNLQATLNGSPVLAYDVKRAVTAPDAADPTHLALEKFAILAPKAGAGGTYNGGEHAMSLPASALIKHSGATPSGAFDINDLTFVVGHEIQHAFNNGDAARARSALQADSWAIATSAANAHDYTRPIGQYIQSGRLDEAKAEIGGWNALVSHRKQLNPGTTLADMAAVSGRVADFVDRTSSIGQPYAPKAGLTFNPDLTLTPTPSNVAAMGKHYFDRPPINHVPSGNHDAPMTLGAQKDSDYPNYYGTTGVGMMVWAEDGAKAAGMVPASVSINMSALGLREELLEHVGIDLGKTNHTPRSYHDTSQAPATLHHFDHTVDGPQKNQYIPVQETTLAGSTVVRPADGNSASVREAHAPAIPSRLDDPGHPDHALFTQVRGHVVDLDKSLGRTPDQHTDNISSALTVQARADGLQRVDQIALSTDGNKIWAVQTPPGRKDHLFDQRTSVPTAEANTPMEKSAEKWPDAMQQFHAHAQEQAMSQQRAQDRQQAESQSQSANGPAMSR